MKSATKSYMVLHRENVKLVDDALACAVIYLLFYADVHNILAAKNIKFKKYETSYEKLLSFSYTKFAVRSESIVHQKIYALLSSIVKVDR